MYWIRHPIKMLVPNFIQIRRLQLAEQMLNKMRYSNRFRKLIQILKVQILTANSHVTTQQMVYRSKHPESISAHYNIS